jgi:hypothetical protein
LKKGDLGGFANLQGERIYGKRYNPQAGAVQVVFRQASQVIGHIVRLQFQGVIQIQSLAIWLMALAQTSVWRHP